MDHAHAHSAHDGHSGQAMAPRCAMHMLWNTQIINTCVVFPQWHISSNTSFFISFLVIVALGVVYEYLRELQKSLDIRIATALVAANGKGRSRTPVSGRSTPDHEAEESALLGQRKKARAWITVPTVSRLLRAILYGATIFLSFFLMLIFMTYNAYLILAVVLGAAIGHYVFGGRMDVNAVLAGAGPAGKTMACH